MQTYRELLASLQSIPEDHLDDNVTIKEDDEYFGGILTLLEMNEDDEDSDILDSGHPYFNIIVNR